jgi:hypothetical protein
MRTKVLLFASIILVAISMAATWAHLLEMPAKLRLSRSDYFMVQQIYRGWAWLGVFIFAALASTSSLAVLTRADRDRSLRCRLCAQGCAPRGSLAGPLSIARELSRSMTPILERLSLGSSDAE